MLISRETLPLPATGTQGVLDRADKGTSRRAGGAKGRSGRTALGCRTASSPNSAATILGLCYNGQTYVMTSVNLVPNVGYAYRAGARPWTSGQEGDRNDMNGASRNVTVRGNTLGVLAACAAVTRLPRVD